MIAQSPCRTPRKKERAKIRGLSVLFAPILLSACLGASSPAPQYYVLAAPPEKKLPGGNLSAPVGPRIGLLPATLPGYLQRAQMVIREDSRVGIRVDDLHRWGE